jgi:hypothetical protein
MMPLKAGGLTTEHRAGVRFFPDIGAKFDTSRPSIAWSEISPPTAQAMP